jgi:hypothetical protein
LNGPGWRLSGRTDEDWLPFILRGVRTGSSWRGDAARHHSISGRSWIETWHHDRQTGLDHHHGMAAQKATDPCRRLAGVRLYRAARRRRTALVDSPAPAGAPLPTAPNTLEGRSALSLYTSKRPHRSWCTMEHGRCAECSRRWPRRSQSHRHAHWDSRLPDDTRREQREKLGAGPPANDCVGSLLVEDLE